MAVTLYELVGRDDRRFSPYCWRTRMALAHKGLVPEIVPVRFSDKDRIAFSGQDRVPVIRDGTATVSDSWRIACHLEDAYPDRPSLFGGAGGRAGARFVNLWADQVVHPLLVGMLAKDIFDHVDPADRGYFRRTREERLGATLEDLHAARAVRLPAFRKALGPARSLLEEQPWLAGDAPGYADFVLFGTFQWARAISALRLIEPTDPLYRWRAALLDLYDGLARSVPAYDT